MTRSWRRLRKPGVLCSSESRTLESVVDVAPGTALSGPVTGMAGRAIADVNAGFRIARVIVLLSGGVGMAGEVEPVARPVLAVLQ